MKESLAFVLVSQITNYSYSLEGYESREKENKRFEPANSVALPNSYHQHCCSSGASLLRDYTKPLWAI